LKIINLEFDSLLVALAGNPYGRKEFDRQVRPHIDNDLDYCLVFPEHIKCVVSSFVQGFFGYWLESMGVDGIVQHIEIKSKHPELRESIIKNL